MDLKTTSLDLSHLRQLTHSIKRWSSGRLLQHIDIDSLQKPKLLIALEDTLEQIRLDYHQNTELFLWEFISDFHRDQDYGSPGNMSKWLYINAFIPKLAFVTDNVSLDGQDTIDGDAMIPQIPPPPQDVSSDVSGHVVATLTLENQPQLRIPPLAHSPGTCFTNDVLTGKLSAKAKARLQYKPSPYYQRLMALTQPEYGHQAKKEHPLVLKLQISPNLSQLLRNNPRYKIMLFCASNEVPSNQCMAMEFPDNSHIYVNNQRMDWSPEGLKNKPGTFSPADITLLCKLQEAAKNKVELRYSNASKMFHASLHLVCPTDAITTISTLIKDKFVTKEFTYRSLKKKIKDDEIMELSSTLSLKCPLSVQRIEVPCRSFKCTHLQCFDAFTFLSINERVHRWICPVCNRIMDSWDEIIVDGYYTDILESTPKSLENVNVSPDGKWDVPVNRIPLDIDGPVPMLSDNELSSSGTNSTGTGNGPIYVIDDDDEENSQSGTSSSYESEIQSARRADSTMEVEEVVRHKAGSKEENSPMGRQETSAQSNNRSQQPATTTMPPASSPSRSESSVAPRPSSQPVPRECQFMDLTLYPSVDVIDLTTDSELDDNDETLVLNRRKRASVLPSNGIRKNNIDTRNANKHATANNAARSTPVLSNRSNNNNSNRIPVESLLRASSSTEPGDVPMEDTAESRRAPLMDAISTRDIRNHDSRRSSCNARQQLHSYHQYHTDSFHSNLSSTLSPPTPGPALIESYPTRVLFSPSSDGDVISLQFDLPPLYIPNSLEGATTSGNSTHSVGADAGVCTEENKGGAFDSSFWLAVSPETAIPPWHTFDANYSSPYLPQSPGFFRGWSEGEGVAGGLQASLSTDNSGGADGQGGEEVGERPNKRLHTSRGYSPLSPELDTESANRIQAATEQYLSS